jgi:hypothetical protein
MRDIENEISLPQDTIWYPNRLQDIIWYHMLTKKAILSHFLDIIWSPTEYFKDRKSLFFCPFIFCFDVESGLLLKISNQKQVDGRKKAYWINQALAASSSGKLLTAKPVAFIKISSNVDLTPSIPKTAFLRKYFLHLIEDLIIESKTPGEINVLVKSTINNMEFSG